MSNEWNEVEVKQILLEDWVFLRLIICYFLKVCLNAASALNAVTGSVVDNGHLPELELLGIPSTVPLKTNTKS